MLPGRRYTPAAVAWILRKRLWLLIALLVPCTASAVWLAMSQPDIYRAQATILVVPPQVPEAIVRSVVAESLQQQLMSITPTILGAPQLERIIAELDLYPELRAQGTMELAIETMRRSITVRVVTGDLFRVSYAGYWPERVMQVTQRLAELAIDQNFKNRAQLASGTSRFLESQLEDARRRLIEQERAVQEYRRRNAVALPSQLEANLQMWQSTRQQLQALEESLARDRDRRLEFEQALLTLDKDPSPMADGSSPGGTPAEAAAPGSAEATQAKPSTFDSDPAAALQDEAAAPGSAEAAQAKPTPSDSDSAAALEDPALDFGPPGTPNSVRLRRARLSLQNLRLRLTTAHPDIVRAERVVERLENAAREDAVAKTGGPRSADVAERARTARIAAVRDRRAAVDKEIAAKVAERSRLMRAIAEYQSRLDRAPEHEAKLLELTRDYGIVGDSYRSLLKKKEESSIAGDLEHQQASQQFRIIEPARLPQRPSSPNRPRLVAFGVGAGLVLGLGLVVLLELRDQSFRTAPEVVHVLSFPVLAMIPAISTRYERQRFLRRLALCGGVLALVVLLGGLFVSWGWR